MNTETLLNYRVSGNGHPVVFLHGFLESNSMWERLLPELSNIKAYCIELYGHGSSPSFKGDLTIKAIAKGVLKIIEKEQLTRFSIVGHSLGGYVALTLLELISESQCDALILLNSHPWEDSEIKKSERTQVADIIKKNKSLFLKQAIPNLFLNPIKHQKEVENLIQEALLIESSDISATTLAMRDRKSTVEVVLKNNSSVTVIQGEHDRLIPAKTMQHFCTSHATNLIEIKEAGHMIHIEQTQLLISTLRKILNRK